MGECENVNLDVIHNDVEIVKRELAYIKSLLVERMTEEDIKDFEQAMKEFKQGKAVKLSDLGW